MKTASHVGFLDQQLAALIMWIPAGVILLVFGLALFAAWLGAVTPLAAARRAPGAGAARRRFAPRSNGLRATSDIRRGRSSPARSVPA